MSTSTVSTTSDGTTATAVATSTDVPILVKSEAPILHSAPGAVSSLPTTTSASSLKTEVLPTVTLGAPKISVVRKDSVPQLGVKKGAYNEYTLEVATDQSKHEVKKRVRDFKELFNELSVQNPGLEIPESIRQFMSPQKIKEQLQTGLEKVAEVTQPVRDAGSAVASNVATGLANTAEKVAEATQPVRDIGSNVANNVATAGKNLGEAGANVVSAISQNVQHAGSKIATDISVGMQQTAAVASQTASNINADIKEATSGISAEVDAQKTVVADTTEVAKIDAKLAATDMKNEVWKQAEIAVENTKQAVSHINTQLQEQVKSTTESTKHAMSELPFVVSDQYKILKEERIPQFTQFLQSLMTKPEIMSSPSIKNFLNITPPPSKAHDLADWKETDMPWLNQKLAVVTGASSGIGWAVTKAMAAKGCHVIMAVRNPDKARAKLAELEQTLTNPHVEIMILDLTRIDSIQTFAKDFQLKYGHLDFLINNAGVMATPERHTADGVELQMATNHFGHFALTALLMNCLANSEKARVVTVASIAHKGADFDFTNANAEKKYNRWQVYQQTALANILFSIELQRRLEKNGITNVVSMAAHPGYANTHAAQLSAEMEGSWFGKTLASVTTAITAQSPEMGALPILFAATSSTVKGGDYCGPKSFNNLYGYPTVHNADDRAYDPETAARLWTLASTTTGVDFTFKAAALKQPITSTSTSSDLSLPSTSLPLTDTSYTSTTLPAGSPVPLVHT